MLIKASDYIANWLAQHDIRHLWAISGAGDVHLLDSIGRHPDLQYICPHHEQAGVMAALAYYRTCGRLSAMITTAGASAANAITGVVDAWADSIPCLIISGQERSVYARPESGLRMWGVQGFDIAKMVSGVTKYGALIQDPTTIRYHLERARHTALSGRPGPVWLDIPTDIQAARIDPDTLPGYVPEPAQAPDLSATIAQLLDWLATAERPVFWLGHGIRLAGAQALILELLAKFGIPVLTAWNGADMLPTGHPLHFGRAGNYGQRSANFVVQNCDLLITIGTRLALPQIGYDPSEFARAARKLIVDIDPTELAKLRSLKDAVLVEADAGHFIRSLLALAADRDFPAPTAWLARCRAWRAQYPVVDARIHKPMPGYINSYEFMRELAQHFAPDEIIVTDAGTSCTCTFQSIALDHNQRLIFSTGLGEMGFGLPGAIGACFAHDQRRVVLLSGDGSIMMNLQEFQTVAHHHLPIKMFLFTNDGYLSIKHTQMGLFGPRFSASGADSGVSCPDFARVGAAFGFTTLRLNDPAQMADTIEAVLNAEGPVLCEVVMHPLQPLVPKLSFSIQPDGSLVSPPIEDLYPFLPRQELREAMLVGMHPKSLMIQDPA
jgi:acetolactate synthase-1/2/3 large subunit